VATGKSSVIPAKAGIQFNFYPMILLTWMPAFAGMTNYGKVSEEGEK
jgi:hypothetical protein